MRRILKARLGLSLVCALTLSGNSALAADAASVRHDDPLLLTYVLFLLIATESHEARSDGIKPTIYSIGLAENNREKLLALTKEARAQDHTYQVDKLSKLCAKSAQIQTREQLASEYQTYTNDAMSNQLVLTQRILNEFDPSAKTQLLSWRQTYFNPKGIDEEAGETIMRSPYSVIQQLEAYCALVKPRN